MRARYSIFQNVQMVKCLLRGSLVPCCFLEEVYSQHPAVEHETTTQHTYLAIPCFVILRTSCVCCRQRSAHAWLHSAAFVCCPTPVHMAQALRTANHASGLAEPISGDIQEHSNTCSPHDRALPSHREGTTAAASAPAAEGSDTADFDATSDDSDEDNDDRIFSALDYIELHDGATRTSSWPSCCASV